MSNIWNDIFGKPKSQVYSNLPQNKQLFSGHSFRTQIGPGEFLFSDIDNDSVKNIDDRRPKTAGPPSQERIYDELSLSKELRKLQEVSKRYTDVLEKLKRDIDYNVGRVKHPISILHKLRVKYLDDLTDIVGVTLLVDNRNEVHETAREIKEKYKILKERNYYSNPKGGFYRARHLVIDYDGVPVEIQIKSVPQYKLHQKAHKYYKEGREMPKKLKSQARRLAKKGY